MEKVLVNTVPHSGTHLVTTILDSFGYKQAVSNYRFYTVRPFFRRTQKAGINWRADKDFKNLLSIFEKKTMLVSVASPRYVRPSIIRELLSEVSEREYIIGHIPFSHKGKEVIEETIQKSVTIIRDPRDMAISMINHVRTRPRHHAYTYLFGQLSSDSERFKAVLSGYKNRYGHINGVIKMYKSMLTWQNDENNLTIKFEDLVGERGGGEKQSQLLSIRKIRDHLNLNSRIDDTDLNKIADQAFGISGTFRKGKINVWKDVFTPLEKKFCRSFLGEFLVELGYEKSLDW
ncbi:sulfotransferase domain-containing protein [Planktomarina temperata]|nr:sulfotransferase domain-containing protein [Planktomarina temperata]